MFAGSPKKIGYSETLELYLAKIEALLEAPDYRLSRRALALLLLQEDPRTLEFIRQKEPKNFPSITGLIREAKTSYAQPIGYIVSVRRQSEASRIAAGVMEFEKNPVLSLKERFSALLMNPATGGPILLLVLYYGLYKFVGGFGAGFLVNFLEDKVFGAYINPWVTAWTQRLIPFVVLRDLVAGPYGIVTLGIRYAVAIILPIVATFFFAFAVVEDSGYLPRLAMLVDQLLKKMGLSGRAVIPLVLGFGCDTMATMVTRTLPTRRERLIATLLLSLAVPCSAQMGVILALLNGQAAGLAVWLGVIIFVFLLVGYLAAKIMPGERPTFYMEIPPLRLPQFSNVLRKTGTRLGWYFREILPIFIFASFLIWVGQMTGVFGVLVEILKFPIRWLGLPDAAAVAFLFGFFRRDYGAAGLYDLKKAGLLSGNQLVVACVTLTLFLPCIAQLLMNIKERGLKMGIVMSVFILFFSFSVGFCVNLVLNILGVSL